MFKIVNNPDPLGVLQIPQVRHSHERNTRQMHDLQVPRTRTKIADRALSIRGSIQWNKLPETIKQNTRITLFKKKVKEFVSQ